MANPSEPRLGLLNHRCPHCCAPNASFSEESIYEPEPDGLRGAPTTLVLAQMLIGAAPVVFARQRCAVCDGVIVFAGDAMIYPKPDATGGRYDTWPEDLRQMMQRVHLHYADDPVVASARLRGVLKELCVRAGMQPSETYVDYLIPKLPEKYLIGWLTTTCADQDACLDPDTLRHADDYKCASFLLELVHVVATTRCGLQVDE